MEKLNTQMWVNIAIVITELIFSNRFFKMKYWGVKGAWILDRGSMKEQRLSQGPLCVCIFTSIQQCEDKLTTAWRNLLIVCDWQKNNEAVC